jgi:hypothetical protein
VIVLRPLWTSSAEEIGISRQRARAEAYYERVVQNIRDLDDDFATGKIAAEEHQTEREQWVQRGSVVLKLLDEMDQKPLIPASADDAAIDDAIEQAVQKAASRTAEPV